MFALVLYTADKTTDIVPKKDIKYPKNGKGNVNVLHGQKYWKAKIIKESDSKKWLETLTVSEDGKVSLCPKDASKSDKGNNARAQDKADMANKKGVSKEIDCQIMEQSKAATKDAKKMIPKKCPKKEENLGRSDKASKVEKMNGGSTSSTHRVQEKKKEKKSQIEFVESIRNEDDDEKDDKFVDKKEKDEDNEENDEKSVRPCLQLKKKPSKEAVVNKFIDKKNEKNEDDDKNDDKFVRPCLRFKKPQNKEADVQRQLERKRIRPNVRTVEKVNIKIPLKFPMKQGDAKDAESRKDMKRKLVNLERSDKKRKVEKVNGRSKSSTNGLQEKEKESKIKVDESIHNQMDENDDKSVDKENENDDKSVDKENENDDESVDEANENDDKSVDEENENDDKSVDDENENDDNKFADKEDEEDKEDEDKFVDEESNEDVDDNDEDNDEYSDGDAVENGLIDDSNENGGSGDNNGGSRKRGASNDGESRLLKKRKDLAWLAEQLPPISADTIKCFKFVVTILETIYNDQAKTASKIDYEKISASSKAPNLMGMSSVEGDSKIEIQRGSGIFVEKEELENVLEFDEDPRGMVRRLMKLIIGETALQNMSAGGRSQRPGIPNDVKKVVFICPSGFQCDSTRCIPVDWRCDGHVDCADQSDEIGCGECGINGTSSHTTNFNGTTTTIQPFHTGGGPVKKPKKFKAKSLASQYSRPSLHCGERRCMSAEHVCDGFVDCPWGQDERNCLRLSDRNGDIGKGRLQVYHADSGSFVPACIADWEPNTSAKAICSLLGYNVVESAMLSASSRMDTSQRWRLDQKLQECTVQNDYRTVELSCSDYACGKRRLVYGNAKPQVRIVGGTEAAPGDWPFLAALLGGPEQVFYCAGVLIADQWVLTASHCVGNFSHSNVSDWTIQLGITRRHAHSYLGEKLNVKRVVPHPNYNLGVAHDNDVALFQLEERVNFHDHLRPVCLPKPDTELAPGTFCTVIGWGKKDDTDDSEYEPAVNEVKVPVLERELCNLWLEHRDLNVTDGMICAGYPEGKKDACQGDSGGPLLCQDKNDKERWFVGGIVSWGIKCAHPKLPGVYAYVPKYVPWIRKEMAKYSEREKG